MTATLIIIPDAARSTALNLNWQLLLHHTILPTTAQGKHLFFVLGHAPDVVLPLTASHHGYIYNACEFLSLYQPENWQFCQWQEIFVCSAGEEPYPQAHAIQPQVLMATQL